MDDLKATVGIRYTEHDIRSQDFRFDRVHFSQQPLNEYKNFQFPDPTDPRLTRGYFDVGASSDAITPRFVLNWSPELSGGDEFNAYASVSRGYKPGGVIIDEATGGPSPFTKETLWSYEIGAKWRGLDNRLQLNGSVFYMDWKDLQIPSVEIIIANNQILNNFRINNSQADSMGVELEAMFIPFDNFTIGGGMGYLDAEFNDFPANDPFVINNLGFDLDGVTLPRAPKWTLNAWGQYDFNVMGMESFLRLEWSHRSSIRSDIEAVVSGLPILDNATTQAAGLDTAFNGNGFGNGVAFPWPGRDFPLKVPSYDVVNLRAGISGERWALTAYVENLFDKNYYTGTQENFGLGGFRIRPHFRVAGVNIRIFSD